MVNDTIQSLNCNVHYQFLNFCTRLFGKLTYSFVAIEVLACSNKKNHLISQESTRYLSLKKPSYVKMIVFKYFCVYKNVSQNKILYKCKLQ